MKTIDLTRGSVWKNIFSFSLPYMLAYFLQMLYGLADLFVIGQYCGVDSTTAVSNGAQVMHMFTVVIIGLAMGTTVRTARAVGAGDQRKASLIIGNTITLFLVLSVALTIVLLVMCNGIIRLLDVPHEAVRGTCHYLVICFLGIPFIVAYNIIASIFRGLGDSKSPMYFVAVACVLNIVLDYLFIGFMDMDAAGAALGTTLSQIGSVVFALVVIRRHRSALNVSRGDLRPDKRVMTDILKIGVPISVQDGFIQVGFIVITIIANGRGLNDAAAVGIVEKLIGLLFIVPSAMLSSVSAISAQNLGAGKLRRAVATLRCAIIVTMGYGLAVSLVLQFVPEWAVSLFTDDARVIVLGGEYLMSYTWDCFLAGIHFCFSGYFTACGYSMLSFVHNFISAFLVRIPLSYALSEAYPLTLYPMGIAPPAGSLVSVVICVAFYQWLRRKKLQ